MGVKRKQSLNSWLFFFILHAQFSVTGYCKLRISVMLQYPVAMRLITSIYTKYFTVHLIILLVILSLPKLN